MTQNNCENLNNTPLQLIYVTTPNRDEALKIAKTVVEEHIAACANIMDGVQSIYWWQGELQNDAETVLILKTHIKHTPVLIERIKALHSYDCPCVVALNIQDGNESFLNWIESETSQSP